MTPVVKLIFGVEYDKTRLTEFAAALSHAARVPIEVGGFQAYLESFGGGLKGMVLAERDLRRPVGKQSVGRAALMREELRSAPIKARLQIAAGDNEFVLLVARRQPDGTLGVVEAVPHNDGLVDKALSSLTLASRNPKATEQAA